MVSRCSYMIVRKIPRRKQPASSVDRNLKEVVQSGQKLALSQRRHGLGYDPVVIPLTASPATNRAPRLKKSNPWRASRSRI